MWRRQSSGCGSRRTMGSRGQEAHRCVLHTASPVQVCWELCLPSSCTGAVTLGPDRIATPGDLRVAASRLPLTADDLCVLSLHVARTLYGVLAADASPALARALRTRDRGSRAPGVSAAVSRPAVSARRA